MHALASISNQSSEWAGPEIPERLWHTLPGQDKRHVTCPHVGGPQLVHLSTRAWQISAIASVRATRLAPLSHPQLLFLAFRIADKTLFPHFFLEPLFRACMHVTGRRPVQIEPCITWGVAWRPGCVRAHQQAAAAGRALLPLRTPDWLPKQPGSPRGGRSDEGHEDPRLGGPRLAPLRH